ncbi:hypothetical protein OSB04_029113 [Centaurea solstitialis]|uniref:HAT C-terminal dimerisation domain-containing protein n=1 Tax=Centaurea solstitialis TaxID=347529 RepID=A0AA38T0L6_9ASTR|nr:hypothetical protein OSB04_029113 [Centaurea solstitialis]
MALPSIPTKVDLNDLPLNPSKKKKISEYHHNQKDEVRRKYLIKELCQPRGHDFLRRKYLIKELCQPRGHDFLRRIIGNKSRRFNPTWFVQYGNWLEYSIKVVTPAKYVEIINGRVKEGGENKSNESVGVNSLYFPKYERRVVDATGLDVGFSEPNGVWLLLDKLKCRREVDVKMDRRLELIRFKPAKRFSSNQVTYKPTLVQCGAHYRDADIGWRETADDEYSQYMCPNGTSETELTDGGRDTCLIAPLSSTRDGQNDGAPPCQIKLFAYAVTYSETIVVDKRLDIHVGHIKSFHNRAIKKCEDLIKQDQSIIVALVFPVATATVERYFSAMKLVKLALRNRICDDFLNAFVICAVEKEILAKVTNQDVMTCFQMMKIRRNQLM